MPWRSPDPNPGKCDGEPGRFEFMAVTEHNGNTLANWPAVRERRAAPHLRSKLHLGGAVLYSRSLILVTTSLLCRGGSISKRFMADAIASLSLASSTLACVLCSHLFRNRHRDE